MKAKVIIDCFRDKHTKKVHKLGTLYEGTQERIEELQDKKWLGEVEQELTSPVIDPRLNGSIADVKSNTEGLTPDIFKELLEQEKQTKKRKGVIEYFESMIALEPPVGEGE